MPLETANHDAPARRITDSLTERLLVHLRDEEAAFAAVRDAVRDLHQSLLTLNGEGLSRSLESESNALRAAERLQRQRHNLRAEIASELTMEAEQLTLTFLATETDIARRDDIDRSRQVLAAVVADIERLNRQNAAMIQQSLSLTRGIVGRLTRTAAVGESYNAGGVRDEAHIGSLVQWGG